MSIENIKNRISTMLSGRRKMVAAIVATALVFCLLTSFVVMQINSVTVLEEGKEIASFTTFSSDEEQLLSAAGVEVDEDDVVEYIADGRNVTIKVIRAFSVYVKTAEEQITFTATNGMTVADVLEEAGVEYEDGDKFSCKLTDAVSADMEITVTRCATKIIKETEIIPYTTETRKSDSLYKGTTSTQTEGRNGENTLTYEVTYEDGKEVGRKLISKETVKAVQNEVILEGTRVKAPSNFGAKMSASELAGAKLINVTATAYCNTSDGGQITALGQKTSFGIVAVDPRVIPLGSKLYITSADGSYVYGYCVAGDTGGAIKGNRVDLFLGSESECRAFGRRPMQVYVLG